MMMMMRVHTDDSGANLTRRADFTHLRRKKIIRFYSISFIHVNLKPVELCSPSVGGASTFLSAILRPRGHSPLPQDAAGDDDQGDDDHGQPDADGHQLLQLG